MSFPCFLEFLVFSLCQEFLVFSSVFPFFSRDFGEDRDCTLRKEEWQSRSRNEWEKSAENSNSVDVSDIFYFFLLGEGEGKVWGVGGWGVDFLLKIRGVGSPGGGGAEGPGGCLRRIWEFLGGGLNIFFGAEMSTKESAGSKRGAEESAEKVLRGPRLCRK